MLILCSYLLLYIYDLHFVSYIRLKFPIELNDIHQYYYHCQYHMAYKHKTDVI